MKNSSHFVAQNQEKTTKAGVFLAKRILGRPEWAKTVLLKGDLGAGKTTFVRGFAEGLSKKITAKSPSFTIIAEHNFTFEAEEWTLVHVDLYRLGNNYDSEIYNYLEEKIKEKNKIVVIEWAENLIKEFELPKNRIEISFEHGKNENERIIKPIFFDPGVPSLEQVEQLSNEFHTPFHVRNHEKGVEKVASQFAKNFLKNGVIVDLNLIKTASLLHDLVRIVNFKEIIFDDFCEEEKITDEKICFWNNIRESHGHMHHGEAASEILRERGFISCADVVERHKSRAIFEELRTFEEKIVYLADKKVLHDKIVTIAQRLEDGRVRHNLKNEELQKKLEKGITNLRDELLALAGFANEEDFDKELI